MRVEGEPARGGGGVEEEGRAGGKLENRESLSSNQAGLPIWNSPAVEATALRVPSVLKERPRTRYLDNRE